MNYSFNSDIAEIRKIIRSNLRSNNKNVVELMNNIPAEEGKFVRALFVLIGGSFGKIEKQRLMTLAAAVELLHLATLIHDDIIDETDIRRGSNTIHRKYNMKSGLFAGDYLFAEANVLFSENSSTYSITEVSQTIKYICEAEISQFFSLFSFDSSVRDYLKRIDGKCASMFSLSLSMGAYESSSSKQVIRKLMDIGYYTGMAFQLTDDLLDIISSEDVLGKPSGNDIKQGIYSLPVILELKKGNKKLAELIKKGQIDDALNILRSSDSVKQTKNLAVKYNLKALKLTDELPETGEKELLRKIIEKLGKREY